LTWRVLLTPQAIATGVMHASGWRRRSIAFTSGAAGALAMAPFDFYLALIIPMSAAVWLIDGCGKADAKRPWARLSWRNAAWRAWAAGWWWGFGFFIAGLWWLGYAFLIDADEFAWALPLGVAGLPAMLAVFPAAGFLFARMIWVRGSARIFALGAGLGLAEWLRGHLFSGFPWNAFGMALGGNLITAQFASLIGLYGLTVIAILIFSVPAVLADSGLCKSPLRLPWAAVAALAIFCAVCGFGFYRLAQPLPQLVEGVKLRIMQPNVDLKTFRPENKRQILAHYLALSARGVDGGHLDLRDITALIWPESAFPFLLAREPQALAAIGGLLPENTVLVTGAARAAALQEPRTRPQFFNAIQVVTSGGHIVETYDKVHLVPFGEYLPFRSLFERLGLHQFVHVPGGFEAGEGRRVLLIPGLPPAAPLICYEAIFPGAAVPKVPPQQRPGFLLNVTDDGWFGSAGPYQHFAQARLRAIEEGLPLVRAANTGISAIVDPYGRVMASLKLDEAGIIDGSLPEGLAPPLFARFPLFAPFLVWSGALALALAARYGLTVGPK